LDELSPWSYDDSIFRLQYEYDLLAFLEMLSKHEW